MLRDVATLEQEYRWMLDSIKELKLALLYQTEEEAKLDSTKPETLQEAIEAIENDAQALADELKEHHWYVRKIKEIKRKFIENRNVLATWYVLVEDIEYQNYDPKFYNYIRSSLLKFRK